MSVRGISAQRIVTIVPGGNRGMKMEKIDAKLPFDWCERCHAMDAVSKHLFAFSTDAVSWIKCEHQDICVLANKARLSIDPIKHGWWIENGDFAECSNCGGKSGIQFDGVEPIPLKTPFCPHCGARMDGDDNEI